MYRKLIALLLAFLTLCALTACGDADINLTEDVPTHEGGISSIRTGCMQQSIASLENCFESTDTGFYLMYPVDFSYSILFYCDQASDAVVPLCSRPDCIHDNEKCDAWYEGGINVCYYNGYLYLVEQDISTGMQNFRLLRVDLDGRNRKVVMESADTIRGYSASTNVEIMNGMLFFGLRHLNEQGQEASSLFYYCLDGSMKAPELAPPLLPMASDGNTPLFYGESTENPGDIAIYTWQPGQQERYLTEEDGEYNRVYYRADYFYKLIDNKLYRIEYGTLEQTMLFDTGLEGEHILRCFPDCIVIMNGNSYLDPESASKPQTLHFYDWGFNSLGEITLDYPRANDWTMIICGETANRILLSADNSDIPRYYIDKAEFGTGNITLHEFELPVNRPLAQGESISK